MQETHMPSSCTKGDGSITIAFFHIFRFYFITTHYIPALRL